MKLSINKQNILNNFLVPISRVSNECSIIIGPDNISSLAANLDTSIICYAKIAIQPPVNSSTKFGNINIKDIKKIIKVFECIPEDQFEIELSDNFSLLKYKSSALSFKFHLVNDTVIRKNSLNIEKIQSLKFSTEFILSSRVIKDILQGSSFVNNINKIYFYCKDSNIYAEITDKNLQEVDNIEFLIGNSFVGDSISTPLPFSLDMLRILYTLKTEEIKVKINNEFKTIMFEVCTDEILIKYIVPTFTN